MIITVKIILLILNVFVASRLIEINTEGARFWALFNAFMSGFIFNQLINLI